jgi:hypothetical protein
MTDFLNSDGETFVRSFLEFGPGFKDKIEKAVDALLDILDGMATDPDLEDGADDELTGDEEPSLGATHAVNQARAWQASPCFETDMEYEGDTVAECDREPMLAAPERHPIVPHPVYHRHGEYVTNDPQDDQERWGRGGSDDREQDSGDEGEPDHEDGGGDLPCLDQSVERGANHDDSAQAAIRREQEAMRSAATRIAKIVGRVRTAADQGAERG